jgi:hypothetical protein
MRVGYLIKRKELRELVVDIFLKQFTRSYWNDTYRSVQPTLPNLHSQLTDVGLARSLKCPESPPVQSSYS